jgi:hypothetical protein
MPESTLDSDTLFEFLTMVRYMRKQGYAIALFTPEELEGVDRRSVEDAMIEAANDVISGE